MSDLEPAKLVEAIVKEPRQRHIHLGRAVSAESRVYILHSKDCLDRGIDLRECAYSLALDKGIDLAVWGDVQDMTVALVIDNGRLRPSGLR